MRLTEDTEQTPENVAKNAFCELLSSVGRNQDDPEIWEFLAKAQCLEELIYDQNGDGGGTVRVSDLTKSLNVERHIAILIGKLCGLTVREQSGVTVLATDATAPSFRFQKIPSKSSSKAWSFERKTAGKYVDEPYSPAA
jgi:hypothetical protein